MYKINLISKEWALISVINVNAIPREDDYIFLESENAYFMVDRVIHNVLKGRLRNKTVVSVVVSRTNDIKE